MATEDGCDIQSPGLMFCDPPGERRSGVTGGHVESTSSNPVRVVKDADEPPLALPSDRPVHAIVGEGPKGSL